MNFGNYGDASSIARKLAADALRDMQSEFDAFKRDTSGNTPDYVSEFHEVSGAGNLTLINADMTQPYGPLGYTAEQLNSIPQSNISSAVQDALARMFSYGYASYDLPGGRQSFLQGQVDMSPVLNAAAAGGQTIGQLYPELRGIRTNRDILNTLWSANIGAINEQMSYLVRGRRDFGAEVSSGLDLGSRAQVEFLEAAYTYDPSRGATFPQYAQKHAFTQVQSWLDRQENIGQNEVAADLAGFEQQREQLAQPARTSLSNLMRASGVYIPTPYVTTDPGARHSIHLQPASQEFPGHMEHTLGYSPLRYQGGALTGMSRLYPASTFRAPEGITAYDVALSADDVALYEDLVGRTKLSSGQQQFVNAMRGPIEAARWSLTSPRGAKTYIQNTSPDEEYNRLIGTSRQSFSGDDPFPVVGGASSLLGPFDPVVASRRAYDRAKARAGQVVASPEYDPELFASQQDDAYYAAFETFQGGSSLSARVARRAISGWRNEQGRAVPGGYTRSMRDYMTLEEQAASRRDYHALRDVARRPPALPAAVPSPRASPSAPSEWELLDDANSDMFSYLHPSQMGRYTEILESARVNATPEEAAKIDALEAKLSEAMSARAAVPPPRQRARGAQYGELPDIPGSFGYAENAPPSRRRDKVFGEIERPVSGRFSGRRADPPGGGTPVDPNDALSDADTYDEEVLPMYEARKRIYTDPELAALADELGDNARYTYTRRDPSRTAQQVGNFAMKGHALGSGSSSGRYKFYAPPDLRDEILSDVEKSFREAGYTISSPLTGEKIGPGGRFTEYSVYTDPMSEDELGKAGISEPLGAARFRGRSQSSRNPGETPPDESAQPVNMSEPYPVGGQPPLPPASGGTPPGGTTPPTENAPRPRRQPSENFYYRADRDAPLSMRGTGWKQSIRRGLLNEDVRRGAGGVDPMMVASRTFSNRMAGAYGEWYQTFGDSPEQFMSQTQKMFRGYLDAVAMGTDEAYLDNLGAGEELNTHFRLAAKSSAMAYAGAQRFSEATSPERVARFNAQSRQTLGPMNEYGSVQYGRISSRRINDAQGRYLKAEHAIVDDQGNAQFGEPMIHKAIDLGASALTQAVSSGGMPDTPASAMATIKARASAILTEQIDQLADAMKKQGVDPGDIQKATGFLKDASSYYISSWAKKVEAEADTRAVQGPGSMWSGGEFKLRSNAQHLRTVEEAQAAAARYPWLESKRAATGKTWEELVNAKAAEQTYFEGEDEGVGISFQTGGFGGGRAFSPPGSGGGGGGSGPQQGRGNLWSGGAGRLMYGAYIAQRMWKMGMGQTMQDVAAYGNYASDVGMLAGAGTGVLSTEAGYMSRQAIGQNWTARGAMQEFGAFQDIGYLMSLSGNQAGSRLLASGQAAVTTGAEFAIGGAMLNMVPGALGASMAGVAGALPWVGLGIGAAMFAGTAGMEIYNAARPGEEPVTWSSLFTGVVNENLRTKAAERYLAEHPGEQAKYGRAVQGYDVNGVPTSEYYETDYTAASRGIPEDLLRPYLTTAEAGQAFPYQGEDVKKAIASADQFLRFGFDPTGAKGVAQAYLRATGFLASETSAATVGPQFQKYGTAFATEMAQYASNMGYLSGSSQFEQAALSFAAEQDPYGRELMQMQAARYAQMGSQIAPYFSGAAQKTAQLAARVFGIENQAQARNWQSMVQSYTTFTPANQLDEARMTSFAGAASRMTPYNAQMITNFAEAGGMAGLNVGTILSGMSNLNLSPEQWQPIQAALSGDRRAMSFYAWSQPGNFMDRMYDQSGNRIWETNGRMAVAMVEQWAQSGRLGYVSGIGNNYRETAGNILKTTDQGVIDAFLGNGTAGEGGMRGLQLAQARIGYQASMASSGIQMRQIALQEQFLWGGGSWNAPAANSMWGLQNQMTQLQYSSQMGDFAAQQERMQMSNAFSIQREQQQWNRMTTTQGFNAWSMDFNQNMSLTQRGWTRQDWQYQDTMRNLQTEWTMEDLNESIRFAGGRERRTLVRQRDRAALTTSMNEEQVDKTRGRQEELWAAEDERFKKTKSYQLELNRMDVESYQLNKRQREEFYRMDQADLARKKSEYQEQFALQKQMTDLEREHQYKSLQLQKEAAGVQAWAAQEQYKYQQAIINGTNYFGDLAGKIEEIGRYDAAFRFLDAERMLVYQLAGADTSKPESIRNMLYSLDNVSVSKIQNLILLLKELQ